jgi:DNA-binding beta-propeller fold protein YncE
VVTIGGGCSFGESGIAPPANRIFLPAGLAADPGGGFLYVVNSNSDLRFNAGTVVAVDLSRIASIPANPPMCAKTRFSRTEPVGDDYCCTDAVDSNIVNCNEPQFIQSNATISIGSFGGSVQLESSDKSNVRRLFVAVRAEPSITYADVTVATDPQGAATVSMRCQRPQSESWTQPPLASCDDNWKVRRPGGATAGALVLSEEPHFLRLDPKLGALFVGHLTVAANNQIQGGGVSSIDICDPQNVHFAGHTDEAFIPTSLSQSVASLSPGDPANTSTVVYAGARLSAAVSGLVLQSARKDCAEVDAGSPDRDLTLVAADTFYSSAFLPHGADIRGIIFSEDGSKAWILHKNDSDISTSPAALVAIDRRRTGLNGEPANTPIDFVQVCGGPTEMQMHDAGSGRGARIFITCYDTGQIYVVDPIRMAVTAIVDAGAGPTSLVFSPTDATKAYLASFFNSHLSVIDFAPGSRTENHVILRMGLPHGYGQ